MIMRSLPTKIEKWYSYLNRRFSIETRKHHHRVKVSEPSASSSGSEFIPLSLS